MAEPKTNYQMYKTDYKKVRDNAYNQLTNALNLLAELSGKYNRKGYWFYGTARQLKLAYQDIIKAQDKIDELLSKVRPPKRGK